MLGPDRPPEPQPQRDTGVELNGRSLGEVNTEARALAALSMSMSMSMSMSTMIGLIMLMGIVTRNSILLVDYAILAWKDGLNRFDRFDALVDACHKRSRPIVMTTITMGAGMLPLALGLSGDPSFRSPMAVAVIGGLITSTLLSLLVVPSVFTYVDDAEHWFGRMGRKLRKQPRQRAREESAVSSATSSFPRKRESILSLKSPCP